ncbi:vWA domain-containing protein [uncultured Methanobrevibacter sp.]|uniref:vWA domain-containing protein n=1 Tax=uncultured Methanobrevibacter sp. TaxID=253161 RepID=UPI0025DD64C1|nr:vWA domain-containing protein [uncultured Methanobrevibacter sp.]
MDKKPNDEMDIIFIMDRSGSMTGFSEDTIGGFNSFIEKEKDKDINTYVTTILFDNDYEILYERKEINKVEKLTEKEYWPRGSTALLDAIGKTITSFERKIDGKALVVIMTDGYENASVEFSKKQIKEMIDKHDWEFIYLGAEIDSYSEASQFGFSKSRIANYDRSAKAVDEVFTSVVHARDMMVEDMSLDNASWKKELNKYD